jgi:hypothetical protein
MHEAKNIMDEIECNYTFEERQDLELLADQLRMMADENEDFENRVFEIGVNAILEEFNKKYVGLGQARKENVIERIN